MRWPWQRSNRVLKTQAAVIGISFYRQQPSAVLWRNGMVEDAYQAVSAEAGWQGLETWLATLPPGLPVVICLDPQQYELHLVEAPAVPDEELADALRFRMRDLLPPNAEQQSLIQAFRLPGDAYRGRMDMAYAAVVNRNDVRRLVEWCQHQSLRLRELTIPELACLQLVAQQEPETAVAVLKLNNMDGVINLYAAGALYLSRRIGTGLQALGVGIEQDGLSLQDDAPLEALALDIQRSLDYFDSQQGMGVVGQLWMLPPAVDGIDALLPKLEENLNVPLRLFSSSLWNAAQPLSADQLIALGGALSHELGH